MNRSFIIIMESEDKILKIKKQLAACFAAAIGLLTFTGCTNNQSAQFVNEISFPLNGISEVTISYDEENIAFYESESDVLTVKEYMTEAKSSYYAKVNQTGSSIRISEGSKPLFKSDFTRYIEVYLPASYHNSLTVTTTNGNIDISGPELSLNALRIDSTSGALRLKAAKAQNIYLSTTSGILDAGYLNADMIKITSTSGSFSCESLDGHVTYTTTSGNADIKSAIGSGDYKNNNSGSLNVVYSEVTGNLSFFNKNESICLTLPDNLEFKFEATTKNGSISTSFQEYLSINGRTTGGTIGEHPTVTVKAETNNGNIEVTQ